MPRHFDESHLFGSLASFPQQGDQFDPHLHLTTTERKHLITITNPQNILQVIDHNAKKTLQLLIRRLIYQVRIGCNNSNCTTTSCFGYKQHAHRDAPLRRLTPLSARITAFYLAEKGEACEVCQFCPRDPPAFVEDAVAATTTTFAGQQQNGDGNKPAGDEEVGNEAGLLLEVNPAEDDFPRDPTSFNQLVFEGPVMRELAGLPPKLKITVPSVAEEEHGVGRLAVENAGIEKYAAEITPFKPVWTWIQSVIARSPFTDLAPQSTAPPSPVRELNQQTALKTLLDESLQPAAEPPTTNPTASSTNTVPHNEGPPEPEAEPKQAEITLRRLSRESLFNLCVLTDIYYKKFVDIGPNSESMTPEMMKQFELGFPGWVPFIRQSLYYLLKDPVRMLTSIAWPDRRSRDAISPRSARIAVSGLYCLLPEQEILRFINHSLQSAETSSITLLQSPSREWLRSAQNLSHVDVAAVSMIVLHALVESANFPRPPNSTSDQNLLIFRAFRQMRTCGFIAAAGVHDRIEEDIGVDHREAFDYLTEVYECEWKKIMASTVARIFHDRTLYDKLNPPHPPIHSYSDTLTEYLKAASSVMRGSWAAKDESFFALAALEFFSTLVLRDWDGKTVIENSGSVGCALQMTQLLFDNHRDLNLDTDDFYIEHLLTRLDPLAMPEDWNSYEPHDNTFHIFSHHYLFPPGSMKKFFRALNFDTLKKSHSEAIDTAAFIRQMRLGNPRLLRDHEMISDSLSSATEPYLVFRIRRNHIVQDAMDQVWGRERRQLLRPLRVRMGTDEGELGLDHGGVQQEFFRLLFAQALDPDFGMFTIDPETRMTWFQPRSLEPLYKFELLGILFSIAVHNSITLTVTFPLAFYRKLLDLPVSSLEHISDGWPALARSLWILLAWKEGDVRDAIGASFEFPYTSVTGTPESVDMDAPPWPEWPADPSPEPSTPPTIRPPPTRKEAVAVTNANRTAYVVQYISFLTDRSISPQFSAFLRGFRTCVSHRVLSILPDLTLRWVVEGIHAQLDPVAWAAITRYEGGFSATHPTIEAFWRVVNGFSDVQRLQLLEFVTATDRVPVNGWQGVEFVILKNGDDDERLPTAVTCYGRLLLPRYSEEAVLRERLECAVGNARGFGMV